MFAYISDDAGQSNKTSTALSSVGHISDHDLERYYLGMVTDEGELAELEAHLLRCPPCVEQREETKDYVDAIRVAGILDSGPFANRKQFLRLLAPKSEKHFKTLNFPTDANVL